MTAKVLSDLELLAAAEKRLGAEALAQQLGVLPNQLAVWRSRGAVSARRRLMLERLMAPAPRAGDIPLEARYFTACLIMLARMTAEGDADGLKAIFEIVRRVTDWDDESRARVLDDGLDYFPRVRDNILVPGGFL